MLETKNDYIKCLDRILTPLRKYYSDGCAEVKCGVHIGNYGEKSSKTEAFSRPLWGLAPLWAGGHSLGDFDDVYLKGLINGTNPDHPEYFGDYTCCNQNFVEMAAIGLSLIICPQKVWEPLGDKEKKNLTEWLWQINKFDMYPCNWKFFPVLVNLGLKNVGAEYDKNKIDTAISDINSYYVDNGWYSDGPNWRVDYYVPFAIYFYGLIYAKVMEKEDPENSRLFKERATEFAKDFIYWFASDGSALPYGRSLTYRFAQCAFFSACIFAGVEPFSMGVMKGIISRNIEYWMNMPIFDNDGILTVGYGYSNINMAEEYNAFGSPYWALKSFLVLALPDDHEFYKCKAEPLPPLEKVKKIPEAGMVIQRVGGDVYALMAAHSVSFVAAHIKEKYLKFTYSSKFAFSVPRGLDRIESAAIDNMLSFMVDGRCYYRTSNIEQKVNEDGSIYIKWSPIKGIEVETTITPTDNGQIRKHRITSEISCEAYDCSVASNDDLGEVVSKSGEIITINCLPNTNLMYPFTSMKAAKYQINKGISEVETVIIYPM